MAFGFLAAAALGTKVLGSVIGARSADKAADAQVQAAQIGAQSQERMFDRGLELQAPYREAGYGAVSNLQGLANPEGRASALSDYYNSAEYGMMSDQAAQMSARTSAATGGLRGGIGQHSLNTIAPQLGQQYLSNQYNQNTGLANLGMGAASQGANAANNLGLNLSQLQMQSGDARAQAALAKGNIYGNMFGDIGATIGGYT